MITLGPPDCGKTTCACEDTYGTTRAELLPPWERTASQALGSRTWALWGTLLGLPPPNPCFPNSLGRTGGAGAPAAQGPGADLVIALSTSLGTGELLELLRWIGTRGDNYQDWFDFQCLSVEPFEIEGERGQLFQSWKTDVKDTK